MTPTSRFRVQRSAARSARMRGFTLIEIMVVVIIVGVLITFATLAIGNRALSDRLETEARRLQQLFAMASEDAEMHGTEMGFVYTDQGYAFVAVGPNGRWMPLLDGPFRPRQVKAPIGLSLRVEGRVVPPTPLADLIAAGQAAKKLADRDQKKATEAAKSGDSSGSSSKKDDDDDKSKAKDDKDTEALKPQAMFLSSGEATAISIDVSARGVATAYRVEIDNLGRGKLTTLGGGR